MVVVVVLWGDMEFELKWLLVMGNVVVVIVGVEGTFKLFMGCGICQFGQLFTMFHAA